MIEPLATIKRLQDALAAERERSQGLEEALRFYAYECSDGLVEFSEDYGERAREALSTASEAVEERWTISLDKDERIALGVELGEPLGERYSGARSYAELLASVRAKVVGREGDVSGG